METGPGWYPDPDGADHFRYFDGRTWSTQTTDDPRSPPPVAGLPVSGSPHPGSIADRGRRPPALRWLLLGLVGVVLVVVVVSTVIRSPDDSAAPQPSGAPVTLGSERPSVAGGPPVCSRGRPNERTDHPRDQRVHGGNLAFPRAAGFNAEAPEPRLTFAHDVVQQTRSVNPYPAWIAQLTVGRLATTDGWSTDPRAVAETALRCVATSEVYALYDESLVVTDSVPFSLDRTRGPRVEGPPVEGWRVGGRIDVDVPGLPFAGDRVVLVVVPDGRDWGFLFGAAPEGDDALVQVLDTTVAALTETG